MKIGSFIKRGRATFGVLTGAGIVDLGPLLGDSFPDLLSLLRSGQLALAEKAAANATPDYSPEDVTYMPLIPAPVNFLCTGINYFDHIEETGARRPEYPTLFFKTLQTFVGHDQPIARPKQSVEFDYEAELAVVISKPARNVPKASAMDYVAGYTCLLDGSIRDYQKRSIDAGKNFYHSSSFGPWLATPDEVPAPRDMRITCRLNGETMQDSTIDQLVFDVADLISYYSEFFALEAGDVISTGTPSGVGFTRQPPVWMKDGDVWEMEISGVGLLRNPVVGA